MAHFRGVVEGSRGSESRLGSKASGLAVVAQSWDGQIRVDLFDRDGVDHVRIVAQPNSGMYGGDQKSTVLFFGSVRKARGLRAPGKVGGLTPCQ